MLVVTRRQNGGNKHQCMVRTFQSVLRSRSLPKIFMSRYQNGLFCIDVFLETFKSTASIGLRSGERGGHKIEIVRPVHLLGTADPQIPHILLGTRQCAHICEDRPTLFVGWESSQHGQAHSTTTGLFNAMSLVHGMSATMLPAETRARILLNLKRTFLYANQNTHGALFVLSPLLSLHFILHTGAPEVAKFGTNSCKRNMRFSFFLIFVFNLIFWMFCFF